jgi:ornithine cyclodeaminase/alanine dehydrogenase-like protein (mu-crystallin family)
MMDALFDIERVTVFDVFKETQEGFIRRLSGELELDIAAAGSVEDAVKEADVICMCTTAKEPILKEPWVKAGAHVCAATGFNDIDHTCALKFDKWAVGWYGRDLEWIEGSELGRLGGLKPGWVTRSNIYADLATEIIPGKKPGRESAEERTIMTHLGMPALDTANCELVYRKAQEMGVGTIVNVF